MAKNKTEIHVTTVFDGELDATDVFVSLISQKYGKTNTKEYLAKRKDVSTARLSQISLKKSRPAVLRKVSSAKAENLVRA